MKRVIITFVFSLFCFCSIAQIQRQILGNTLGKSTKQQVLSNFRSKGKEFKIWEDGSVMIKKQDFGTVSWDYVFFDFFKNKLYKVYFTVNSSNYSSSSFESIWEHLCFVFNKKYSNYIIVNTKNQVAFKDKFTLGGVSKDVNNTGIDIQLVYYDSILFDEKMENDESEL